MEIHQTRRFVKLLAVMDKAGKNQRDAAGRAREIVVRLQSDPLDRAAENKRTRYGELRLDHCRKYDLACGFRLIGLKRKNRLIFVYIGSHDDCQRWIENNRDNLEEIDSLPVPLDQSMPSPADLALSEPGHRERDEYEEQLMARIDEQTLQEVFPVFT